MMVGAIIADVYALVLAFMGSRKGRYVYFVLSLSVIALFLAMRSNWGNDLPGYARIFNEVSESSWSDLFTNKFQFEKGYLVLNKVFSIIGFNSMLAFLSVLSTIVYYSLIEKTVPSSYLFLALAIFILNPNILLIQSSMVRQTIAITLFLFSIKYIYERKIVPYLLVIILAMQFHTSALILFPFYFCINPGEFKRKEGLLYIVLYLLIYLKGGFVVDKVLGTSIPLIQRYQVYKSDIAYDASLLSQIFKISLMSGLAWWGKGVNGYRSIAIRAMFWCYIISGFGHHLGLLVRFSYYFEPFMMAAIPYTISKIKNKQGQYVAILVILLYFGRNFILFFQNPTWSNAFMYYKTFFM